MGKIASAAKDDNKKYTLTEKEFNYLKLLNYALMTSVLKDKCISGMLYQICHHRFGYDEEVNLMFEIDLDSDSRELMVREIPTEAIEEALDK